MNNLAVYGTLKTGYGNNAFLKDCEKLGKGYTVQPYAMDTVTSVPMVFKEPNIAPIMVEVYRVPDETLKGPLDLLESNGFAYNREEIEVSLINSDNTIKESLVAWLYFGMDRFKSTQMADPNTMNFDAKPVYVWGLNR